MGMCESSITFVLELTKFLACTKERTKEFQRLQHPFPQPIRNPSQSYRTSLHLRDTIRAESGIENSGENEFCRATFPYVVTQA